MTEKLTQLAANHGKDLTPMQQAFVLNLVRNGGDKEQAAIDAGYSQATARVQAYELLHKPKVVQAVLDAAAVELLSHAPKAMSRLRELTEARSEYVALQASQDILDRVGLKAPEKHDHRIDGDIRVNIDLG